MPRETVRAMPIGAVLWLMASAVLLAIPASFAASALELGPMARFVLVELMCFALPAVIAARALGGDPGASAAPASARELLGIQRPSLRAVAGAALVGATLWLLLAVALAPWAAKWQTEADLELARAAGGADPLLLRLLVMALVPAICEELLVRGAITRGLAARLGTSGAVLISSVYFSLLHLSIARALPTLVLGVVLALAVLRTGSLLPAVIVHLLNNACAVLASDPAVGPRLLAWAQATYLPLALVPALTLLGLWLLLGAGRRVPPSVDS